MLIVGMLLGSSTHRLGGRGLSGPANQPGTEAVVRVSDAQHVLEGSTNVGDEDLASTAATLHPHAATTHWAGTIASTVAATATAKSTCHPATCRSATIGSTAGKAWLSLAVLCLVSLIL